MVKAKAKTKTKTKTKKATVKKPRKKATPKKKKVVVERFFESIGRRKTAKARVRIFATGSKQISVNGKELKEYFPIFELQQIVISPLVITDQLNQYGVSAKVKGGGVVAQAEAIRHGITKALVMVNSELRQVLKKVGYLTRDPRMRERKKFGLKRARRAPQWSKR